MGYHGRALSSGMLGSHSDCWAEKRMKGGEGGSREARQEAVAITLRRDGAGGQRRYINGQ